MERSNSDNSNISGMSLNDLERRYSDNSVLSNDSRLNYSNHSSNNHITNNNSSNYVSNSYFENLYYPTSSMPMNNNSVANSYSYNINNTGTNLPPPRVRVPGMHLTPQQTRHARRIYVGNIPSSYCEEETIKTFLNSVISKGLNEVNDNSYILSIYTNPKKCFSFVELKSMELATACLDLDGIIFKQTVLKVLRANEYKPELVPPSLLSESIKLDLSSFPFANNRDNNNATANNNNNNSNNNNHMNNNLSSYPIMNHNHELTLDSIIDFCSLSNVTRDSLSIVGYPFDQNAKRSVLRGLGCSFAPKSLRHNLRKISYGAVDNPEYGINLSRIVIHDVGDVLPGKVYEETRTNLSYTVSEICCRNSIPFVIGGSNDQAYQSISGLMNVIGGNIGIVSISPQLDTRVLDDTRFCPRFGMGAPSCDGRYICFGAQGSQCSMESAQIMMERRAEIVWLNRDIRNPSMRTSPVSLFKKCLKAASINQANGTTRPIVVSLDMGAVGNSECLMTNSNSSPVGFTIDEVLEMIMIAGSDPNVMLIDVSEFNPDTEETRGNMILPEMLYRFAIGVASRYYGLYSNVSSRSTVSPTQALVPEEVNTSPRFSGRVSKGPSQDSVGIAPFPSIELSTMNTSGSIQRKDYSIPVAPRAGIPPPHSSLSGLNPGLPSTTGGYGSFQTLASGTTSGNSSKVQSFYSQYGNDPIGSGLKMMYSNDFTSVSYDSKDSLGPNLMSKKRNMYNERVDTIGTLSESFDDHLDLNDANNSLIRGESARASALATLRSESPDDMDK